MRSMKGERVSGVGQDQRDEADGEGGSPGGGDAHVGVVEVEGVPVLRRGGLPGVGLGDAPDRTISWDEMWDGRGSGPDGEMWRTMSRPLSAFPVTPR